MRSCLLTFLGVLTMETPVNENGFRYSNVSDEVNLVCSMFWEKRKGRWCEGCPISCDIDMTDATFHKKALAFLN
jgi:hypothetical protein